MPTFMSLAVTKRCPTMRRDGISPTERGRIRSVLGTNLKRRPGKVQGTKKLLEVRMEDVRTLRNMTMSSRLSGLEFNYLVQNIFNFRSKKYTQRRQSVNRIVFSIMFPLL